MTKFLVQKASGGLEPFSKGKLLRSLKRSGLSAKQSERIAHEIARSAYDGQKTRDIYKKTLGLVKENSLKAAAGYSLKRALLDLGPDGHMFESFVARYFQKKGYVTQKCQTIKGRWVKHEVDVIAKENNLLQFVECKFHNRNGIKNDIKIALYIKARRDDLKEGPMGKQLDSFYLASNTAFTLDALTYANGTGIKLLGINAPTDKSFLEEIKDLRLYPVTSLRGIKNSLKKRLLDQDVLTIQDLKNNPAPLRKAGLSNNEVERVLQEIEILERNQI